MVYLRVPNHDAASLCQWRSSERTYCSAQNITHSCAQIDPAFGSNRNEWIHAFRTLQEPANRFRVCEGKRSFWRSRKAGKKERSQSGPTEQEMLPAKDERISLENLTKPDKLLNVCKILLSRLTNRRPLSHYGRFHDHRCHADSSSVCSWVTQRRAARPREHATCNTE